MEITHLCWVRTKNEHFLSVSLDHWRNLLDSVLTIEQYVYVIQGPADIIIHKWSSPSSEIKILPVWSSNLIFQMICNGLNITHFLWRLRHQTFLLVTH